MARGLAASCLVWLVALAAPADARQTHVIQSGETLGLIAGLYGCSVKEVQRANGLKDALIRAGQSLKIPDCDGKVRYATYTVRAGDILGAIASNHGCSVEELQRVNDLDGALIHPGDDLVIPRCNGHSPKVERIHVVEAGQMLGGIARRYGCSVSQLKGANGVKGHIIHPGDRLKIPDCPKRHRAKRARERRKKKQHRGKAKLDTRTLPKLMRRHGFRKPKDFKALVIEFTLDKRQAKVISERPFDWYGTSRQSGDWNPASTIKLFSAIAALELTHAKGFRPQVQATFYDFGGKKKRKHRVSALVYDSIVESDNLAHNRLVQLVGYDRLNGDFLSDRRGVVQSAIHKPYEKSRWVPLTGRKWLKRSPKIVLRHRGRKRTLHARRGKGDYPCPYSSACTTLADLAEAMRRMMLHEQLPRSETYRLSIHELRVLRRALRKNRKRGMRVVDHMLEGFGRQKDRIVFFHKPGYSNGWLSDVVYVYKRRSRRRWIVAVAGNHGRNSLNSAARAIGKILAADELAEY